MEYNIDDKLVTVVFGRIVWKLEKFDQDQCFSMLVPTFSLCFSISAFLSPHFLPSSLFSLRSYFFYVFSEKKFFFFVDIVANSNLIASVDLFFYTICVT